jgi:hypothetical protein
MGKLLIVSESSSATAYGIITEIYLGDILESYTGLFSSKQELKLVNGKS